MPLNFEPEDLIIKHLRNELTEEESIALEAWKQKSPKTRELFETLTNEASLAAELKLFKTTDKEAGYNKLQEKLQKPQSMVRRIPALSRIAAAAIFILMLSVGGYFYFNKQTIPQSQTDKLVKNDVAPGRYKAKLTLADGTTIVLDSAVAGELTRQGKTIIQNKDGHLVYEGSGSETSNELIYNTLSTAKGETYASVLADGSKVWLNSASSIKFPVAFSVNERKVEITGEAYFEIAHDASKPFNVSVSGINVQVLGTHFNINAYVDEATVKTTLLEGSVKVSKGSNTSLLTIGKQAEIDRDGEIKIVTADIDEVIAWKNGLFQFESADLKTILRQLARWYDVEIIYEGKVSEKKYFYIENKNRTLASVLQTLKAAGIKFRIEGKKLFVET